MEEKQLPLVSIGIPVYNVEQYIGVCLNSVLNQTYPNIEILLIDDCGTDHSIDIIKGIVKNHKRGEVAHVIRHKRNFGVGQARNTAMDSAHGKYIYYVDSDDYIKEDPSQKIYKKLTNEEIAAELCYPATLKEILSFKRYRYLNLLFFSLGHQFFCIFAGKKHKNNKRMVDMVSF